MTENSTYIDETAQNTMVEENLNEKLKVAAATAEAETDKNETETAPDTGKFKSVQALMSAYLALEAEFTRRSQRLKELENKAAEAPSPGCCTEDGLISAALGNPAVKDKVVGEYLREVFSGKRAPVVMGGVSCAAPQSCPKSVKEAGELAKNFLKN